MKYSVIATWKMSYEGVKKALDLLKKGECSADAILCAIHEVESNEKFHSVGYSGLPNEEGVVECDAGYMDGATLQVGAVGALKNVVHAVDVAKAASSRRFNNVLVGEGASQFARELNIPQENLLTDESYQQYLYRKSESQELASYNGHDTVGMVMLDRQGNMVSATSTSGLFMKKKGRVGDSPLVGSGFYCDNEYGGAAATGVGEEIMRGCLSYEAVRKMKEGQSAQMAAEMTIREWHERMLEKKGYAESMSLICMDREGNIGVGTNVTFAFVCGNDEQEAEIFLAMPHKEGISIRPFCESDADID